MPDPSPPPRRILLADADAFFVAVARLADPEGAGRARLLIVGGSPASRGVVTSASYEARAYGVRSAMPMVRALKLCPRATVVPVPRGACSAKSREIRQVLGRFAPLVAAASIDEWYLDLAGTEALYEHEPLACTAHRIREAVIAETGLSISLGGGTSRLVAKLAVERAKPKPGSGANGVHVVEPGAELDFLAGCALAELPQVGPRMQERLQQAGLHTVSDARQAGPHTLVRLLGERAGLWLDARIRGVDTSPVEERGLARSISRDETFARDLHDDAELEAELWQLVLRAGADLRRAGLQARTITVRVRDADFTNRSASRTLGTALETDQAIGAVARALFAKLRRARRVGARLLGVGLSQLAPTGEGPGQLALFDEPAAALESPRDRALAHTLDALRQRFGAGIVVPGAAQRRPEPD
ncbi:MAG TPA: DNA polymerase IV [Gemmatimonadaceae bacterium]|jgi:DNA polymerase-4|nr:DNA polymerase IV [Gemmatimonadaceae bacterium]